VVGRVERIPLDALSAEVHREVDRHRRNAVALGALADHRHVSDPILARLPDADVVVYSSTGVRIDRRTAHIDHERDVRIARRRGPSR